ncbi:MAG TPA: ferritin-like domain-containing protein [Bryobacteraceae bacterium]|nr:ferritin-like domain-containing protein [Bryobacteraceae bacterium]
MGEDDWLQYFRDNSREPSLPWGNRYRLSGAERVAVIESIQQFQLGENAAGKRLLQRAEATDPEYAQALRLFVQEEQRHSALLARFLEMEGTRCLRRHWVHGAFRWVRGWAGLELRMRVLATAEVLAIPYYTALREATGSPLLRSICSRILSEEAQHLRFQAFTFARFSYGRPVLARHIASLGHRWFLMATTVLVWVEHERVFRAGGYSLARVWKHSLSEGAALLLA